MSELQKLKEEVSKKMYEFPPAPDEGFPVASTDELVMKALDQAFTLGKEEQAKVRTSGRIIYHQGRREGAKECLERLKKTECHEVNGAIHDPADCACGERMAEALQSFIDEMK